MTRHHRRRRLIAAAALCAILFFLAVASLTIGTESLDLRTAWREIRAGVAASESPTISILLYQRLPRTLAALLAGCGLAIAGCSFQALLRNPLATPYTLGIASAGALGAWCASIAFSTSVSGAVLLGFSLKQVLAFTFAMMNTGIIYLIAANRARVSSNVLLLAGVSLGMLSNAGIMFMRYFAAPDKLVMMDRWLMGGVNILGYGPIRVLAAGVIPCSLFLLLQAAKFDQLGLGADIAEGRGVDVRRLQTGTFVVGSLMVAIIVSEVGPIGFVGLIVPHAVRAFTGSRHRILMPLTMLAGSAFLCLCDIIARKILTGETPIGIVTSLFGVPFFLFLLFRKRDLEWEGQ